MVINLTQGLKNVFSSFLSFFLFLRHARKKVAITIEKKKSLFLPRKTYLIKTFVLAENNCPFIL
jgi:hypothetical protein